MTTNLKYKLVWRTALLSETTTATPGLIVGENTATTDDSVSSGDWFNKLTDYAIGGDITVPLNNQIVVTQEYSHSLQNKTVTTSTLGGNSVTQFGQNLKKVNLRVNIIKAGNYWIPYAAGLEALHFISANPGRYYGNLYLMGYDSTTAGSTRRYRVSTETLSSSHRSDSNSIVTFDMALLVVTDLSQRVPSGVGTFGRL